MKRKRATVEVIREKPKSASQQLAPTPLVVLQELFDLLEDYAPMWYSEDLRGRAVAALSVQKPKRLK